MTGTNANGATRGAGVKRAGYQRERLNADAANVRLRGTGVSPRYDPSGRAEPGGPAARTPLPLDSLVLGESLGLLWELMGQLGE
jgi:hypothetical protein